MGEKIINRLPVRSGALKHQASMKATKSEKAMFAVLIPIAIYFFIMAVIAIKQFIQAL